jgi:hypothetical protein
MSLLPEAAVVVAGLDDDSSAAGAAALEGSLSFLVDSMMANFQNALPCCWLDIYLRRAVRCFQ